MYSAMYRGAVKQFGRDHFKTGFNVSIGKRQDQGLVPADNGRVIVRWHQCDVVVRGENVTK